MQTPTQTASAVPSDGLVEAVALLEALTRESGLTSWIAGLEVRLQGVDGGYVRSAIERDGIGRDTLDAALLIKRVSGQINVLVHAIGILNALPRILEPGEIVESLSLGAGNTGRPYDLERTDASPSSSSRPGVVGLSRSGRTNSSRTCSTWSADRPAAHRRMGQRVTRYGLDRGGSSSRQPRGNAAGPCWRHDRC